MGSFETGEMQEADEVRPFYLLPALALQYYIVSDRMYFNVFWKYTFETCKCVLYCLCFTFVFLFRMNAGRFCFAFQF